MYRGAAYALRRSAHAASWFPARYSISPSSIAVAIARDVQRDVVEQVPRVRDQIHRRAEQFALALDLRDLRQRSVRHSWPGVGQSALLERHGEVGAIGLLAQNVEIVPGDRLITPNGPGRGYGESFEREPERVLG